MFTTYTHTVERVTQREYLQALAAKGFTRIPEWITMQDMLDLYRQMDSQLADGTEQSPVISGGEILATGRWRIGEHAVNLTPEQIEANRVADNFDFESIKEIPY